MVELAGLEPASEIVFFFVFKPLRITRQYNYYTCVSLFMQRLIDHSWLATARTIARRVALLRVSSVHFGPFGNLINHYTFLH